MPNILVVHGPNLNMLGKREVGIYGDLTLTMVNDMVTEKADLLGATVDFIQSNAEHELIDCIHKAMGQYDFIIINPAAFTHTSVALRDALLSINIPFVEVHLSNVHKREPFRQHSYFSDKAQAVICGCGANGYIYALDLVISLSKK